MMKAFKTPVQINRVILTQMTSMSCRGVQRLLRRIESLEAEARLQPQPGSVSFWSKMQGGDIVRSYLSQRKPEIEGQMPLDAVAYFVDSQNQLCDLPRGVKLFGPLSLTNALWQAWRDKVQVEAWFLLMVQPQPEAIALLWQPSPPIDIKKAGQRSFKQHSSLSLLKDCSGDGHMWTGVGYRSRVEGDYC